ncbi:MAG TPA: hypothetical protein VMW53_07185 [archaeon]|nr:hypothetical protein [archaeon]
MQYNEQEIQALAGLAKSNNSIDWELFKLYPIEQRKKAIDLLNSTFSISYGRDSTVVKTYLCFGLEVEFDIYSKINFISIRKLGKIIEIIEDNIASAMLYISDKLKEYKND